MNLFWTTPDGNHVAADANNPVSAGNVVEIYCTGLGSVNQTVIEGTASPTPAANTTQRPVVTIGELPATVTFSGLTWGAVGLYQVNAMVALGGARRQLYQVDQQASQAGVTIAVSSKVHSDWKMPRTVESE